MIIHTPHGHVFYGHFGSFFHGYFFSLSGPWHGRPIGLIGLTAAEKQEHLERGVGQANRFAVVPSGIDLDRFRKARDEREGDP